MKSPNSASWKIQALLTNKKINFLQQNRILRQSSGINPCILIQSRVERKVAKKDEQESFEKQRELKSFRRCDV